MNVDNHPAEPNAYRPAATTTRDRHGWPATVCTVPTDDWYRNSTWTPAIREAFFKRLKRSRSTSKAQYLRIQANYLQATNDPALVAAALDLLNLVFSDYPEPRELAQARLQQAHCYALAGDDARATEAFRDALNAERTFPQAKTQAWLEFGWFAVERRRHELYDEVLNVLSEFARTNTTMFPVDSFRYHGIRALILAQRKAFQEATTEARLAMEAAARTDSGYRFHPTVGLVQDHESSPAQAIARLARGESVH